MDQAIFGEVRNVQSLVVDDEKLERAGIRFLLSMEEGEWEIYEAANGKLALNELRKHPVDLMLTDIKMPHMDGLELSKKAREEYPDLEIIIFSGYGDFAFAQEAILPISSAIPENMKFCG